ncbi:REP-associated tyrosine transposase [Blastopirellula sp. J2-11]|uniref:REP-associated tyrosine transposase n=1 Tax=Blastopirellula sp. J2-11 TaxID=2943192 RepID=UPI00396735D7
MPNYRRFIEPGGIYFFTLVTSNRRPIFPDMRARMLLGDCLRQCRETRPFQVEGIVLLPDHLHAIWPLPPNDNENSKRWSFIKSEFTRRWLQSGGVEMRVTSASQRERRRGVWQPRFGSTSLAMKRILSDIWITFITIL